MSYFTSATSLGRESDNSPVPFNQITGVVGECGTPNSGLADPKPIPIERYLEMPFEYAPGRFMAMVRVQSSVQHAAGVRYIIVWMTAQDVKQLLQGQKRN